MAICVPVVCGSFCTIMEELSAVAKSLRSLLSGPLGKVCAVNRVRPRWYACPEYVHVSGFD